MFISLNAQINASICLLLGHNLLGLDRWHLSIELPVAELDPILADNQVAGSMVFSIKAANSESDPRSRQIKFSSKVSSTVLRLLRA